MIVFEDDWWTYVPAFVPSGSFESLLEEIEPFTVSLDVKMYGRILPTPRKSCFFGDVDDADDPDKTYRYGELPGYSWRRSPTLVSIRDRVKSFVRDDLGYPIRFDYCLAHVYRDGRDSIAPHNDKEALDMYVVSISLGATRKFRLRPIGTTRGWIEEFHLASGDLLIMKAGCQRRFEHWVPKQKDVVSKRINLTFRSFD